MSPCIETITPLQADILSGLARACFIETFGHLYPSDDLAAFLEASYAPDRLSREIEAEKSCVFGLFIDGEMVGYGQVGPVGLPHDEADLEQDGEIKRLYLLKAHHQKGLGQMLMERALAECHTVFPQRPLWVGVWSENFRAQKFYQKYGFDKVGEYQFPVGKTLDDEWIMRRAYDEAS